jgi:ankyrin repeat protein
MDYTKEIERLQKEQEQALRGHAPSPPLPNQPTDGAQQASTPVSAGATDAGHGVPSNAASVVSWSLLVAVLVPLAIAWSGLDDAWDGYYLHPFAAMFVVVPLLMAMGVLWIRHQLLQKIQSPSSIDMAQTGLALRSNLRWVSPAMVVLMLGSFAASVLLPDGVPLGLWLGLPEPATSASAGSEAAADATEATEVTGATVAGEAVASTDVVESAKPAPADDYPALLSAVDQNDVPAIQAIGATQQDMNVRNANGYTGLHMAAARGAVPTMQALITAGADVNAAAPGTQGMGRTPIDSAVFEDQVEAVKLLLANGAKVGAADQTGWHALHYAAYHRASQSMPLLIAAAQRQEVPIDVRAMGRRGETALMKAAEMNHLDGIRLLVQAGASVDMLDKYGKNALDYAEFFKKQEASDLLCSLGARPTPLDRSPPNQETTKRTSC